MPSFLPNFKPRRDGYGLACYGINNRRPILLPSSQEEPIEITHVGKISSLVVIGPILNKIELFKNVKINKRCMDCGTHTLDIYIFFLVNYGCISINIGPINIKA